MAQRLDGAEERVRSVSATERKRLDDVGLRKLPVPSTGNRIYYDAPNKRGNDWTAGFGVRITAARAVSFVLNYRNSDGTERRYTIGRYPDWSLAAARDEAQRLKRAIDQGADPVAEDREKRNAETISDLCARFLEEHVVKKRPATQRDYTSIIKIIEVELGNRKVASVEYRDIDKLHRRITATGARYRANRTVAVASKLFNLAIRWKLRGDNPCKGIERNTENHRERYLTADELTRLTAALDAYPDQKTADVFRLLLLTGARSGEAFSARWEQLDLAAGKWVKPSAHTKQRKDHGIPLSPPARQLLQRIRASQGDPETGFVFPSDGESGHVTTLKKSWREICKAAGIANLRIHDLRHSYASFAINAGWSLPVIGALLGHTQPGTTHRYAHLVDDVLARATNSVGAVVSGKKKAQVVPLRGRS
jgi:integrase